MSIGQAAATNVSGKARLEVGLTRAARRALRRTRGVTVVAFGTVVDLASNRTTTRTATRLTR